MRPFPHSILLCAAVLAAGAGRADIAPPPPPPPTPSAAPTTTTTTTSTTEAAPPKKISAKQTILCGCASSRFLGSRPAVVGANTLGVWLHGEARLGAFSKNDAGALVEGDAPFAIDLDERGTAGASRLVRVRATRSGEGLIGILRPNDKAPRDVLTSTFEPSVTAPAPAPVVKGMWLEPVETRERRDCGTWQTQRLAFELAEGSVGVDAFVVTDLDSGTATVVDARHVGAFGIGHVDVCEHGAAVGNVAARVAIAAVSGVGATSEPWQFAHDGTGATPVARLSSPASADPDLLTLSFPVPGEPEMRFSWLSVGGIWILLPATGIVAAILAFIALVLRRRRMAEVVCSSCHKTVPVDVLDRATDGFFCPHCGASGMWKGKAVDVNVTTL
jgi:DNA-directed RNA polymerase subunit RPC12/RpoP